MDTAVLSQGTLRDTIARPRIIIPGGSGFLGRILSRWFAGRGWEVVILSRVADGHRLDACATADHRRDAGATDVRTVQWDAATLGEWSRELDGAAAVVNLTGRTVNCRYTVKNRRAIMDSRVLSTRVLGEAIAHCQRPPAVWLNSSTATIYKHTFDRAIDENGEIGATAEAKDAFSIEVARAWEKAFDEAAAPATTRRVALRTAMVFGLGAGGVFHVLRRLVRFGLGGRMASGQQFVSWIHEEDFCHAIEWLMGRDDISGVMNLAAPNPLANRDMMRAFRRACHVPIGLPAARWMLEIGAFFMRTETELIIKSRRVVPGRLLAAGFEFRYPEIGMALEELLHRP
jgi:uncharacterized protein